MEELYLERIVSDIWSGYIVATKKGLAFVSHVITNLKDVVEFQMKYYPNSKLISNAPEIVPYREQFYEYLNGTRYEFDFPIDVSGTVFQEQVWQALYEIPYGETASYLDIAKRITTVKIKLPKGRGTISKTMLIASKHKLVAAVFEEKFWKDI